MLPAAAANNGVAYILSPRKKIPPPKNTAVTLCVLLTLDMFVIAKFLVIRT